jgi:hypothetical protein
VSIREGTKPYYAPHCRRGEHHPVDHHYRFGEVVGRFCECPCHFATNDGTPWWADVSSTSNCRSCGAPIGPGTNRADIHSECFACAIEPDLSGSSVETQ